MRGLSILFVFLVMGVSCAYAQQSREVVLTDQEIDATISMMEECVKAKGFGCADAAVYMRNKLNDARKPKAPSPAAPPSSMPADKSK